MQQEVEGGPRLTQLTAFFLYNEQHEVGINNEITYMNLPTHFTWKQKVRQWSLRQNQHPGLKKESIGRLPFRTPAHGDIFYL